MNFTQKQNRGSSMLIAIGLGALLILIVIGAIGLVLSALKSTQRIESRNIAYFVAEGGVELALYDIGRHGTGYEISSGGYESNWQDAEDGEYSHIEKDHAVLASLLPSEDKYKVQLPEDVQAWWGIRSLTKMESANRYVIPARGEGTAGENCDLIDDWQTDDAHPCNWNKMNIVSSVNVSLYRDPNDPTEPFEATERSDYQHLKQISGVNLDKDSLRFYLRIPEQYDYLKVEDEKELTGDETVVGWFFSGQDSIDRSNQLFYADSSFNKSASKNYRSDCNSEITASLLNNARDGAIFSSADFEGDGGALDFGLDLHGLNTYKEGGDKCSDSQYDALYSFFGGEEGIATEFQNLRVSLVSNIQDEDDKNVDNLEYQIISDRQIPDVYITIDAEGFVGTYPQVFRQHIQLRVKQNSSAPVYDFAFIEG